MRYVEGGNQWKFDENENHVRKSNKIVTERDARRHQRFVIALQNDNRRKHLMRCCHKESKTTIEALKYFTWHQKIKFIFNSEISEILEKISATKENFHEYFFVTREKVPCWQRRPHININIDMSNNHTETIHFLAGSPSDEWIAQVKRKILRCCSIRLVDLLRFFPPFSWISVFYWIKHG